MYAGADAERAVEISGAWLVLAQVAALDPSAPSWEFLQVCHTLFSVQCSEWYGRWYGLTPTVQYPAEIDEALHATPSE